MYAIERRREIVTIARSAGRVGVPDLAVSLGVAPETIRRDLADLEQQGLLTRVHGGALPADRISYEGTVTARAARNTTEKNRIARRALAEIGTAESIYLDEGSTSLILAQLLDPDQGLTVVTGSMPVAQVLGAHPRTNTIVLGGQLRSGSIATAGSWPVRMLAEFVIELAFLGANGVSPDHGFTCPDVNVAAVKRCAVAAAQRNVVLADSSKFGLDSFVSFASPADVDLVITGSTASKSVLESLREKGVQVVVA